MLKQDLTLQIMNWNSIPFTDVIDLTKDELGGQTMIKFVGLRPKSYSYLIDDGSEDKKSKRHEKVCYEQKT